MSFCETTYGIALGALTIAVDRRERGRELLLAPLSYQSLAVLTLVPDREIAVLEGAGVDACAFAFVEQRQPSRTIEGTLEWRPLPVKDRIARFRTWSWPF